MVFAVKEFYPYLYGFTFTIVTDHNPLVSLKGLKDTGGRLTRRLMFLQQFKFDVKYKQGSQHINADALSRTPSASPQISVLNGESQLFASVRDLVKAQKEDPQLAAVRTSIGTGKIPSDCPPGLRQ